MDQPMIWVLSDGTMGMEVQSMGLAEALSDTPPHLIRIKPSYLLRAMPVAARLPFYPTPRAIRKAIMTNGCPDLVITTGRRHAGLSLLMRRVSGGKTKTVHIQDPRLSANLFDLLVVPSHDKLRGENVLVSIGSLNRLKRRLTEASPLPAAIRTLKKPLAAVMLGGSNRRYVVNEADYTRLGDLLVAVAAVTGTSFAIIPSRRSLDEAIPAMKKALGNTPCYFWDGQEPNPYPAILTFADAVIVTADSVNMTSEACSVKKPVFIAELKPETGRVALFQQTLAEGDYTRPMTSITAVSFPGEDGTVLDETMRIAALIRQRLFIEAPKENS